MFTCRGINQGIIPGTIATNSSFEYSNDGSTPTPEGFIVSNVNTNFNTGIDQYLDFTFSFDEANNSLTTNLCIIERIY